MKGERLLEAEAEAIRSSKISDSRDEMRDTHDDRDTPRFWQLAGVAHRDRARRCPVVAHHAFGAEFDREPARAPQGQGHQGRVGEPARVDPSRGGESRTGTTEEWMVEGGTPNTLLRRGINRDSLKVGTEIVVDGYQSKDRSNRANGRDVTFPDGRSCSWDRPAPARRQTAATRRSRRLEDRARIAGLQNYRIAGRKYRKVRRSVRSFLQFCNPTILQFHDYPENPIHRPPHATVPHNTIDVIAASRLRIGPPRPSSDDTTFRCAVNVKRMAPASDVHLDPERHAVIALHRFREKEQRPGHDHHDQAADQVRLHLLRQHSNGLPAHHQAEEPEVDEQNRLRR